MSEPTPGRSKQHDPLTDPIPGVDDTAGRRYPLEEPAGFTAGQAAAHAREPLVAPRQQAQPTARSSAAQEPPGPKPWQSASPIPPPPPRPAAAPPPPPGYAAATGSARTDALAAPQTEVTETPQPQGEVRRFMTATDFLDRRADTRAHGPATWGWRGVVRRMSGGAIKPKMSKAERAYVEDRSSVQREFDGPRTIVFVNPKGGAAKTTGVLAAGYTFGTVRGGGVVAWDNNETRGTLGIRGTRGAHRNTTRELLDDLGRFNDVYQSRIGDLGAFVRSQGDAHFDVLASDERPDVTGQIHADDFVAVHELLERFYRIVLVDTGNNMRAENWLAAAEAADLLVVTSTVREDTGYSGLWMLDALQESGYPDLKHKTITVLSDPSPTVDDRLARDLVEVYEQRTRGVFRVPFDPALVAGSSVQYAELSRATRRSWLRACAAMAEAL